MAVLDVAAGEVVAHFDGHAGDSLSRVFSADGDVVYSVGPDGHLRHWDARSGTELAAYPAAGGGWTVSLAADGRVLVTDAATGRAALLDTGARGELWGIPTCGGFVIGHTLDAGSGYAAVSDWCPGEGVHITTYVVDLTERTLAHTVPGHHAQDLAVSPDGTRFVRQDTGERPAGLPPPRDDQAEDWIGPLRVRDLATGKVLTELEGLCTWDNWKANVRDQPGCAAFPETPFPVWNAGAAWAPDSSRIAVVVGHGNDLLGYTTAVEWDAATGAHPLGVKGWSYRRVKNDEIDAAGLADPLLRTHRLPEAWIAPRVVRELREVVRHRAKGVALRSGLKAQLHAVLAKEGVAVPMSDVFDKAGMALLADAPLARLPAAGRVAGRSDRRLRLRDRALPPRDRRAAQRPPRLPRDPGDPARGRHARGDLRRRDR